MQTEFLEDIKKDCQILLQRALLRKTLCAFGLDGNGQFGTDSRAHYYEVNSLIVDVESASNIFNPQGSATILLQGYDAGAYGHIFTDNNLRIAINKCLKDQHIKAECWTWGNLGSQGSTFFTLDLDIPKLLDW